MNCVAILLVLLWAFVRLESSFCQDHSNDHFNNWQNSNQDTDTNFVGGPQFISAFRELINHQPTYFGMLHTLKAYTDWAMGEESVEHWLKTRLEHIKVERQILITYLRDSIWWKELKSMKTLTKLNNRKVASGSYWLSHKYASILPQYFNLLKAADYTTNFRELQNGLSLGYHNRHLQWINNEDLYLSMSAFLHIQENYYSPAAKIMSALEYEYEAEIKLKPVQCAEIGMFAMYRKRHYMAVDWLGQAWKHFPNFLTPALSRISLDLTKYLLWVAVQWHNTLLKQYENYSPEHENMELYKSIFVERITSQNLLKEKTPYEYVYFSIYNGFSKDPMSSPYQYKAMCMGGTLQPPEVTKSFKCYYENKRHPYLRINPIKAEVLYDDPPIYQFYEMIGDNSRQEIIATYTSQVRPSQVVGMRGMDLVSTWRTSAGIGMTPKPHEKKIYRLAEYVSGLKIWGNSEHTQYVEYTYGRFYTYHGDSLTGQAETEKVVDLFGDRIATMLYYLELPEAGGLTPFCQAGVYAHPVKNSAVFWYNMYRNGTSRLDADHGACPVLHGHKIIMNHWIHHHGNWNHRKCSLNQFE